MQGREESSDQPRAGRYQIDEQAIVVMLSILASERQLYDYVCQFLVRAPNVPCLLQGFQFGLGSMHLASHVMCERRCKAKNVGPVPAYSAMRKNDQRAKFVFR